MNKNKMIMAAIGGIALAAVLVFVFLAMNARSAAAETRGDIRDELRDEQEMLEAETAPTQESVDRLAANAKEIRAWRAKTLELLSAGDVVVDKSASATAFKAIMIDDARALSKLPGGVEGRIVAENFDFGFKSFINEPNIPTDAELPTLKRQWAEVKSMVETLASCGVVGIREIIVAAVPKASEAKRPGKGRNAAEPAKPPYEELGYTVRFAARPAAVAKALNAFTASRHLMFVQEMALEREQDMLREMLGGGKKEEAGGGRRRRRRQQVEEKTAEGEGEEVARKGLVTDPQVESPILVTLKVKTIDFGTNGTGAAAEKPAAADNTDEDKEDEE